ncbi:hypothetical protein L1887_40764 [Cichorium endivia]|nr:hypothetical protein L1887_40764 [Cichorium endivia]
MKDLRWRSEERQTAAMEEAGGSDGGKAEDGSEGGANTSGRGQETETGPVVKPQSEGARNLIEEVPDFA